MIAIAKSRQIDLLQIGSVADQSNVPIKTIRYYEEIGLLKSSGRKEGKFRLFASDVIKRIGFIKRLQKLGLSLQEIAEILQVYDRGLIPCKDIEHRLKRQVLEIDRHIAELTTLRREISTLLQDWMPVQGLEAGQICPILKKDNFLEAMNKSNKTSRKRPSPLWGKVKEQIWLVFPFGIVAIIGILAVINYKPQTLERFEVTTQGNPLPPLKAGVILAGTTFPNQGQKHIPEGERVIYNSNPPTSGSHYQVPAAWEFIAQSLPVDERLVHNLEHGGIIISYNPDLLKSEDLEKVKAQARELRAINPRLIVVPRTSIDTAIALTAWGYLQKLQGYDSQAIKTFYNDHVARSPECQNGLCPI